MDLEYLISNAARFAYELRKNFPEGENPVRHFVCEKEVVVLSTKKIYIFYVETIIDYKFAKLIESEIIVNGSSVLIELMKKKFQLKFKDANEQTLFVKYFTKYKD